MRLSHLALLTALSLTAATQQALATTAVLCGDPKQIDQDERRASIHLILDREAPKSANEVRAFFLGREARVTGLRSDKTNLIIDADGRRTIFVRKTDIHFCDGEELFNLTLASPRGIQAVRSCRCFED